jgi:hypothetical protein
VAEPRRGIHARTQPWPQVPAHVDDVQLFLGGRPILGEFDEWPLLEQPPHFGVQFLAGRDAGARLDLDVQQLDLRPQAARAFECFVRLAFDVHPQRHPPWRARRAREAAIEPPRLDRHGAGPKTRPGAFVERAHAAPVMRLAIVGIDEVERRDAIGIAGRVRLQLDARLGEARIAVHGLEVVRIRLECHHARPRPRAPERQRVAAVLRSLCA